MYIPIWAFVLLIVTNGFTGIVLGIIVYLIALWHDLHEASKVARGDYDNCPYYIEGGQYETSQKDHD